jgi:HEAT repeat protein
VRRTAAERLEASGGGTAITALVNALNDPDASVVLAAIDALEFAADTEHIPLILASGGDRHANPEVREAFIEMIEFLE